MTLKHFVATPRAQHHGLSAMLALAVIAAVGALSILTLHGTGVAMRHVPAETLEIVFAGEALF